MIDGFLLAIAVFVRVLENDMVNAYMDYDDEDVVNTYNKSIQRDKMFEDLPIRKHSDRRVRNAHSQLNMFNGGSMDLEAEIQRLTTDEISPDGEVWKARYRHRSLAKNELTKFSGKTFKNRYHRASRRHAKLTCMSEI